MAFYNFWQLCDNAAHINHNRLWIKSFEWYRTSAIDERANDTHVWQDINVIICHEQFAPQPVRWTPFNRFSLSSLIFSHCYRIFINIHFATFEFSQPRIKKKILNEETESGIMYAPNRAKVRTKVPVEKVLDIGKRSKKQAKCLCIFCTTFCDFRVV